MMQLTLVYIRNSEELNPRLDDGHHMTWGTESGDSTVSALLSVMLYSGKGNS